MVPVLAQDDIVLRSNEGERAECSEAVSRGRRTRRRFGHAANLATERKRDKKMHMSESSLRQL